MAGRETCGDGGGSGGGQVDIWGEVFVDSPSFHPTVTTLEGLHRQPSHATTIVHRPSISPPDHTTTIFPLIPM